MQAEVIYTSMGMPLFGLDDPDLRAALFRAFNDWACEYCSYDLKRLIPLGLITLEDIPAGARIGTSSARRSGLLAELRPDLEVVPLRGNVDTRLRKLDAGEADAIVLAAAGLIRLGLQERIAFLFDPTSFVPEAGQGALALQVRAGEEQLVAALDDARSHEQLLAERARVAELGGGCTVPVAAHAWHEDGRLHIRSWVAA